MTYRPSLLPPAATAMTVGAVKPNPQTLAVAADGTLSAVLMAVTPRAFGAIVDGGTFGDGGSHPASANGFSNLAALQAIYPFATALSDDMAGLMIQAAIIYADTHKCREVLLDAGIYRNIPTGIVMPPATNIRLRGAGRAYTIVLCSPCGTNPGITVQGSGDNASGPVEDIGFWGFDTKSFGDPSTGSAGNAPGNTRRGNPDPMLYTPGSFGIRLSNCYYVKFKGLSFQNFDRATDFAATGNNYLISFDDCIFQLNNVGFGIEHYAATNSYENITLFSCVIGNNNTGLLILFGDGNNNGVVGDVTLYGCSIDYNVQRHINYAGAQSPINTRQNCVRMIGGHMESNSDTSGDGTYGRVFNGGDFRMFNVEVTETGDVPQCLVYHGGFAPSTCVDHCRQSIRPFTWVNVYNTSGLVTGGSNYGGPLASNSTGLIYTQVSPISAGSFGSDTTLSGNAPNALEGTSFLISTSCAVTIPADGGGFNYAFGTSFIFRSVPGQTGTFVQGSGCTITSSGTGLTFGGTKPARVELAKIGPSAWIATGQMS